MFFGKIIALRDDAVIDCLIKWAQLAHAVDHNPALNHPCLRAWTPLSYFPSLFLPVQSSLFTLLWAEFFISASVQNAKGDVNNFRVTLVYQ